MDDHHRAVEMWTAIHVVTHFMVRWRAGIGWKAVSYPWKFVNDCGRVVNDFGGMIGDHNEIFQ